MEQEILLVVVDEPLDEGAENRLREDGYRVVKRPTWAQALSEVKSRSAHNDSLFRGIFKQAGVGVAEIDSQTGTFIQINQAYCDILGYSRAELESLSFQVVTHPEDLKKDLDQMERLRAGEINEFTIEKRYLTKGGQTAWVNLTVSPMWAPGEAPTRHIAIVQDITGPKRVEAALRESARNLRLIAENSSDTIFAYDMQNRLLYVNAAVESFTGYSVAELKERNFINWLHPDDEIRVMAMWQRLVEGQGFENEEFRIVTKNGQEKWCSSSWGPLYDEDHRQIGVQGRERDITDRKHSELALHHSRTHTAALVEAIPDLIFRLDRQGVFLDYRADRTDLYAQDAGTLVGLRNRDISPPEFADLIDEKIRVTLESRQAQAFEYQMSIPGQGTRYYEARMAATGLDQVTAIVRNITDRKKAEDELRAALEEKEMLMQELQHRVKNSLSVASGLIDIEKENLVDEHTQTIFTNTSARIQTIASLYDQLNRAGSVDRVDLRFYLKSLVEKLSQAYIDNGGRVKTETDLEALELEPRRAMPLGLIVNELVTNSLKYAFPADRSGTIRIALKTDANKAILLVADDGVGSRFSKSNVSGAGMGMNLVTLLARQLGAKVDHETGEGTRVQVEFPV